jgi:hypothetical protein
MSTESAVLEQQRDDLLDLLNEIEFTADLESEENSLDPFNTLKRINRLLSTAREDGYYW